MYISYKLHIGKKKYIEEINILCKKKVHFHKIIYGLRINQDRPFLIAHYIFTKSITGCPHGKQSQRYSGHARFVKYIGLSMP